MRVWILAAVALTTVAACSTSSPSAAPAVPVAATPSDLKPLVGKWEGEYVSESTGRSGSIVFELKAGATEARGDVLMVPRGSDRPLAPARLGKEETLRTMPQVLSIRFVNAQGGVISGVLEPYRDPDCDCPAETTFVGTLNDDTIEGTFTTVVSPAGPASTGRWKVSRKK